MTTTSESRGKREGYRSGLEQKAAQQFLSRSLDPAYETTVLKYQVPPKTSRYSADFRMPNGIVVETKGRWITADRQKHVLIREQYPSLDLRIVFMRPQSTISKQSKTTYSKYADDHGLRWAKMHSREHPVPPTWFDEPPNEASLDVLRELGII